MKKLNEVIKWLQSYELWDIKDYTIAILAAIFLVTFMVSFA
tara:strand:- start:1537 stop:1659 length:123 start_codon:yes stop_codon:yes gene_type:complete